MDDTMAAATTMTGKRALVTGAGQRVGAAIALALGAAGMDVAVHYHRSAAGAEAVCAQIAGLRKASRTFSLGADLSDHAQVAGLVDRAVERLGGLDLLVASAASYDSTPLSAVTPADLERSLRLNLHAPLFLAQRAQPALAASGGSVVLVTCTSPQAPYRDYVPYIVSKGALQTLMRALAVEMAPAVRVNAVAPGTVLAPPGMSMEALSRLRAATPLGRIGEASDVAGAVLYLASAPFVTGVELVVDGGRLIGGL